jgi:hypothetical protein
MVKVTQKTRAELTSQNSFSQNEKKIVCNKAVSLETRKQVLQTYIKPILIHGSEVLTNNRQMEEHIEIRKCGS